MFNFAVPKLQADAPRRRARTYRIFALCKVVDPETATRLLVGRGHLNGGHSFFLNYKT